MPDPVCLRAAREWFLARKGSVEGQEVREMLDRACITKESGPACLLMMIANTPKGSKPNQMFDAAARQLSDICDIDPAPESCREIAPFRPRVMNLPRPADPAQTNALSRTITDIAFGQVVGEEATFRSRCPSPTACGAYVDLIGTQITASNGWVSIQSHAGTITVANGNVGIADRAPDQHLGGGQPDYPGGDQFGPAKQCRQAAAPCHHHHDPERF